MKALAILGSIALFFYFVGVALLTFHNVSKFAFGHTFERTKDPASRFWMRQVLILFWPLVLASAEGRYALYVIWTGNDDRTPPGRPDLAPDEETPLTTSSFTLNETDARTSNRRKD